MQYNKQYNKLKNNENKRVQGSTSIKRRLFYHVGSHKLITDKVTNINYLINVRHTVYDKLANNERQVRPGHQLFKCNVHHQDPTNIQFCYRRSECLVSENILQRLV